MDEISVEKRFEILCRITRAQHFAWREAVAQLCPEIDVTEVVDRMWELTGLGTGKAYECRIDLERPVAPQVAASIVWSSQCMGEDARVELGEDDEAFVVHADCPWFHWHKREGLLAEDRPGCDAWFRSTLDTVNRARGTRVQFETIESLPEGGSCCRRRLWQEVS